MAPGFISRRYRTAMLASIKSAARCSLFRDGSLQDGLRAIRRFEEINGIAFDPFNQYHNRLVAGGGAHEGFHRRLRLRDDHP